MNTKEGKAEGGDRDIKTLEWPRIDLAEYLALARTEMAEYDSEAKNQELHDWHSEKNRVLRLVMEIAHNPNSVTWAIEGGDILLPAGLSAEESARCFAENFFLCVRDGEDVDEFASMVVSE